MEAEVIEMYWQAITTIEAQQMLVQMTLADWPNLKKSDRETLHRQMHKKAYAHLPKRTITPEDLAEILNNG